MRLKGQVLCLEVEPSCPKSRFVCFVNSQSPFTLFACAEMSTIAQKFLEADAETSEDGNAILLFSKVFAENCMESKEIGPRWRRAFFRGPWIHHCNFIKLHKASHI